MKTIKRVLLFGLLLVGILAPLQSSACGCGMGIAIDPSGAWNLSSGNTSALLHYADGIETLAFARNMENSTDKGKLLLVPIPGDPKKVQVDIANLPSLDGFDLREAAKLSLHSITRLVAGLQIYPQVYYFMFTKLGIPMETSSPPGSGLGAGLNKAIDGDVTIYDHLDKRGVITEVVTAKTADSLGRYLTQQGLDINPATIPVLARYIGQDYSFVVSWKKAALLSPYEGESAKKVSPEAVQAEDIVGLVIDFPTDRMYYPLIPSSAFPGTQITEQLNVLGHVTPKIPEGIEYSTTITYNRAFERYKQITLGTRQIRRSDRPLNYTTVTMTADGGAYTQDLWIDAGGPTGVKFASWSTDRGDTAVLIYAILITVLASFLASGVIGSLVFTGKVAWGSFRRFGLIGLWNLPGGIIGLAVALIFIGTKEELQPEGTLRYLRSDVRKLLYLPIFSVVFLILIVSAKLLLQFIIGS